MSFTVSSIPTTPFDGQQTGTSGLRKKVAVVRQPNYIENWLESLFQTVRGDGLAGATLVVGGDGRYFNSHVLQVIFKMAAAHRVAHILVGHRGLFSTPAVSAIIRGRKAFGGIILTASHNPGGPENDFGIKYNVGNGGPAPESVTGRIYEHTKTIKSYSIASDLPSVDLSSLGEHVCSNRADPTHVFRITVIDSVDEYLGVLKSIFDFQSLKALFARRDFKFAFDGLHGVSGPYAKRIFAAELGADPKSLANCEPKEDFGGHHPDPNLTYAADLVALMRAGAFDFGAASDGDADRNMVLGKQFFVNPSDSVAIIAAHASRLPAYKNLRAVARSMPTSEALDRVANALGLKLFEVPTGWKFFGNIMDEFEAQGAPLGTICGEESFGTGSSHVREKDGLWAVLAWLSIVALHNADASKPFVSVESIVKAHWQQYGRNVFSRYDYEEVSSESAAKVMATLHEALKSAKGAELAPGFKVANADDFQYTDPFDKSVTSKQGVRFLFDDGSRFVMRLSGTGSSGATIRLYAERVVPANDTTHLFDDAQDALKPVIALALKTSKLTELTGRTSPTVIT